MWLLFESSDPQTVASVSLTSLNLATPTLTSLIVTLVWLMLMSLPQAFFFLFFFSTNLNQTTKNLDLLIFTKHKYHAMPTELYYWLKNLVMYVDVGLFFIKHVINVTCKIKTFKN